MSENIKKRKIQKGGGINWDSLGEKLYKGPTSVLGAPLGGVLKMGEGAAAPFLMATKDVQSIVSTPIEELSPIDAVRKQLEDSKSPEQKAMEKFKGQYAMMDGSRGPKLEEYRMFAEPAIWDLFYDEPCWINPETGSFELQVALEELWHKWYLAEDVKKIAKEIMGETENEGKKFDQTMAFEKYQEKYDGGFGYQKFQLEQFFDKIMEEIDNTGLGYRDALKKLGIVEHADEIIYNVNNPVAGVLSGDTSLGANGTTKGNHDWSKWGFCFLFKFIMGPVGPLILKLMPYFFKFLFTVIDFVQKITLLFTSPFIFYKNRDGDPRLQLNVSPLQKIGHIVGSYFGTVIPINLFSHKYGEILGKGQFGKLIFSMAVISAGIILLGYISVFVFLLVFALYCGKTVSMFGDNIDEQKKK
jgi:hypothetical protein